jgi:hypothetical protein
VKRAAAIAGFAMAAVLVPSLALSAPPDLTGVWAIADYRATLKTADGATPPLDAQAKAVYEKRLASAAKGDRAFDETLLCLPPGLPRLMLLNKPFEILQREKVVYFVHQDNRMPRRAYFGEPLPVGKDPLYLGYSVARWEGDALVIESSGFRDSTLLDDSGLPHSEAMRLTERYQLDKDGKTLRARFTVEDPETYARAWSTEARYVRRANFEIPEEVCAETLTSTHPQKRKVK